MVDKLYIGGMAGAGRYHELKSIGVTHVVNMANYSTHHECRHAGIEYLIVSSIDMPSYNIEQHFDEIFRFIDTALRSGGCVYVHCMAGISRASTAVIMYLMRARGMRLSDAHQHVKRVRPCIQPNVGFWSALKRYEQRLAMQGKGSGMQRGDSSVRKEPQEIWPPDLVQPLKGCSVQ